MDVPLTPNYFVSQPTLGIGHNAKQKHSPQKLLSVDPFADIHCDGINGIGAFDLGIAKRWPQRRERAQPRRRPERILSKLEAERERGNGDFNPRIELHEPILTEARIVAHLVLGTGGRSLYFSTAAGTMKVSA